MFVLNGKWTKGHVEGRRREGVYRIVTSIGTLMRSVFCAFVVDLKPIRLENHRRSEAQFGVWTEMSDTAAGFWIYMEQKTGRKRPLQADSLLAEMEQQSTDACQGC